MNEWDLSRFLSIALYYLRLKNGIFIPFFVGGIVKLSKCQRRKRPCPEVMLCDFGGAYMKIREIFESEWLGRNVTGL